MKKNLQCKSKLIVADKAQEEVEQQPSQPFENNSHLFRTLM